MIFTNSADQPILVLDADGFIRSQVYSDHKGTIQDYCHKPFIITDGNTKLGQAIKNLKGKLEASSDTPIKFDMLLYWSNDMKRVITGADVFGRLLRGI